MLKLAALVLQKFNVQSFQPDDSLLQNVSTIQYYD